MIKAVLFDMDHTLIDNPPERFTINYVMRLIPYLASQFSDVQPEQLRSAVRQGILTTIADRDPMTLNQDVFYNTLAHLTGVDRDSYHPVFQRFIQDIYPELMQFIKPRQAALDLVRWLNQEDYAVAVATNPLFPLDSVKSRLIQGGFELEKDVFWLITSIDTFHFTKPSMEFFEEVLTRMGFEPDEALMVGDDWENDIEPAIRVGLNTFYMPESGEPPDPASKLQPDAWGTMDDLYRLIVSENWLDTLKPYPLTVEQIIPRLQGNVAALLGLVSEIPERFWHQQPDQNEWTPMEIVVHLRDREADVQCARLKKILAEHNPFLATPEEPPAPGSQDVRHEDGAQVVRAFAEQRQETIHFLQTLTDEQWMRPARHSVFGPTSLLEMAAFTARHDRLHINQLCQTLGKCD